MQLLWEYNPEIDHLGKSLDINGRLYESGGVCQNCRLNTQGINCKPKFYRPYDKPLNATDVCQRNVTKKIGFYSSYLILFPLREYSLRVRRVLFDQ